MRRQGPHQLVSLAKLVRNRYSEHVSVPPREEMRGLAAVDRSWLESIVQPDRHVQLLFPVLVHVAEHEVPGAIGVFFPAFVCGRNWLPLRVGQHLRVSEDAREAARQGQASGDDEPGARRHVGIPYCCCC